MRLAKLFTLFIFALFLASAVPVRAETAYYGLYFDGNGQVIAQDSDSLDVGSQFTIIVLFNAYETSGTRNIVGKGQRGMGAFNYDLVLSNGYLSVGFKNSTGGQFFAKSSVQINQRRTYFVAGVYDGQTLSLYLNLTLVASVSAQGDVATDYNPALLIANSSNPNFVPFVGRIYLVLIYNRSLSYTELQQVYENPLSPPTTGLVLLYAPDSVDTINNIWVDKSGSGNDGTITGVSYVPLRWISTFNDYKLNFKNSYLYVGHSDSLVLMKELSIVAIVKPEFQTWKTGAIVAKGSVGYGSFNYGLYTRSQKGFEFEFKQEESGIVYKAYADYVAETNETILIAGVYSDNAQEIKLYINNAKVASAFANGTVADDYSPPLIVAADLATVGGSQSRWFEGDVYLVLIYARALSDSEIQQIYESPNNPPLDGLVLWYSPYTYDPVSDRWLNRAPIFPTIPLVEELDAQNYGATAERVSIPKLYVYDTNTSELIPYSNVSLTLIANNTTTALIPSMPILPYNATVDLNISATNYESRLLSTWTGVDLISVYLEPIPNETELDINQAVDMKELMQNITSTVTIEPINPYAKAFLDSGGSFGDTVKNAIKGDTLVKLILPQGLIFIITIIVLWQTQSPLAGLGGTLITWAMFIAMLGEKPNLQNSGMTFVLVVFLIAWTLWDLFYNYSRET
jgi:hypothetical protein